jgi:hypothetical protein
LTLSALALSEAKLGLFLNMHMTLNPLHLLYGFIPVFLNPVHGILLQVVIVKHVIE